MEGTCAGKVNPGMAYNSLHWMPMFSDEMLKFIFKNLQQNWLGGLETVHLLNGLVKLHLGSMEIVHGYLMGVQNVPHHAQ